MALLKRVTHWNAANNDLAEILPFETNNIAVYIFQGLFHTEYSYTQGTPDMILL